jgi:hypothetical protein
MEFSGVEDEGNGDCWGLADYKNQPYTFMGLMGPFYQYFVNLNFHYEND